MSMSLTKWEPFKELKEMEERFNQLFPKVSELESNLVDFAPSVNTREGDYAYHVEVKDNRLLISGERKEKKETKKDNYQRVESSYGKFERSFTLPAGVDGENVKASCEDGVLEVTLPKVEKAKTGKQIKVT